MKSVSRLIMARYRKGNGFQPTISSVYYCSRLLCSLAMDTDNVSKALDNRNSSVSILSSELSSRQ